MKGSGCRASRAPGCSCTQKGQASKGKLCEQSKTGTFYEWKWRGALRTGRSRAGRGWSGVAAALVLPSISAHPNALLWQGLALQITEQNSKVSPCHKNALHFFFPFLSLFKLWNSNLDFEACSAQLSSILHEHQHRGALGGGRWEQGSAFTFSHHLRT